MFVFLSWSGERSKAVAKALERWLPDVIQAIDPWMSSDIEKGVRWNSELSNNLENSRVGIICLTSDNLDAPWILYEAGAISKTKDAHSCTFLLDVKPSDIGYPLAQFQHTSFEKEDVRKLIKTIGSLCVSAAYVTSTPTKEANKAFPRLFVLLDSADFYRVKRLLVLLDSAVFLFLTARNGW